MQFTYDKKKQMIRITADDNSESDQLENLYLLIMRYYKGTKIILNSDRTIVTIHDNLDLFETQSRLCIHATNLLSELLSKKKMQ